jgi:hypothetical protein
MSGMAWPNILRRVRSRWYLSRFIFESDYRVARRSQSRLKAAIHALGALIEPPPF